jgi:hypothetical protein
VDEQVNDTVTNNICQISASPRNRSIFRLLLVSHFVDRWGESSSNSYCRVMVHITHAIARAGVYKSIQEFVAIADSDSGKQRWNEMEDASVVYLSRKTCTKLSQAFPDEATGRFARHDRAIGDQPLQRGRQGPLEEGTQRRRRRRLGWRWGSANTIR